MAFLSPSPIELMVIAVIALIVLGPNRLPEVARSVGKGMREMRDSFQDDSDEEDDRGDGGGPLPPEDPPEDDGVDDDASFDELDERDEDEGDERADRAERESVGGAKTS